MQKIPKQYSLYLLHSTCFAFLLLLLFFLSCSFGFYSRRLCNLFLINLSSWSVPLLLLLFYRFIFVSFFSYAILFPVVIGCVTLFSLNSCLFFLHIFCYLLFEADWFILFSFGFVVRSYVRLFWHFLFILFFHLALTCSIWFSVKKIEFYCFIIILLFVPLVYWYALWLIFSFVCFYRFENLCQ